jgi:vacuolar-type H+-ATPase subunit C/Vma6
MSPSWEALAARARGLSTHLLAPEHGRQVERAGTLAEVAHALRDTPYARFLPPGDPGAAALELAVVRSLAERMALLARWAGREADTLRAIYLAQDAQSIRDVVRGLLGGLPPERRIAGAIPTPFLGRKELETLARAESAGAVAATLVAWGHPLGSALLEEAGRKHADPYRLEAALARRAAEETSRAARKAGRRMRAFVRDEIDAGNAVTALLLVGARAEGDLADFFIEGGSAFSRDAFVEAASSPDRVAATEVLAKASAGTTLAAALRDGSAAPAAFAARILSARIERLAREKRVQPVTAVPVLLFVLRLRREARLVRRALWGAALAGGRSP